MREEYDFSQGRKNPYSGKCKMQVTIRIDRTAIEYFRQLAGETGISYQNLINLYLVDCARNKRKMEITFK